MEGLNKFFDGFIDTLLSLLPRSPFADFIDKLATIPYLPYINWFIPVSEMIAVGTLWIGGITIFYLYSVIARWVKLIS